MKLQEKQNQTVSNYLMWVGALYYPTVKDFIQEAKAQGISKRLGHLPHNLVLGKSKIFLAHDDGLKGEGFIFGYFIPSKFQYLAYDELDIPVKLYDAVEWVDEWSEEEERGCGSRVEGLYTVTQDIGEFVVFKHARTLAVFDATRKRFRGLLRIGYSSKILKAPKSAYTIPPSQQINQLKPISDQQLLYRISSGSSLANSLQKMSYESGSSKNNLMHRYRLLTGLTVLKGLPESKANQIELQREPKQALKKSKLRFEIRSR